MNIIRRAAEPSAGQEFSRRAACAWIRAADAGVIDADELGWLLAQLEHIGTSREGHAAKGSFSASDEPKDAFVR